MRRGGRDEGGEDVSGYGRGEVGGGVVGELKEGLMC